jgi:2-methylfumaryl-CoA isomerase
MRVVEVSSFVAAPLGGMTLAELGADVVRVDPIGGGPDRGRWPLARSGASLYWAGLNKGKRSVTADFRSPEGQEIVARLITAPGPDAGIVLTNQAGRPWLAYESLAAHREDLIHVGIQGHYDGSPAVDYTVNAETGFPSLTGPPDYSGPVNHVLPAWDMACGLQAALAILAAERQRRRTGAGQQVHLALADVALAMAGHLGFLAEAQIDGIDRGKIGNHLYGSFARDFPTADGNRIMLVALTPRHWADLVAVTGLAETMSVLETSLEADFSTESDRFRHREVLAALLAPWFARRALAEIREALRPTSVLWSTFRSFTDLTGSGEQALRANPMMAEVDQPGIGTHLAPGSPLSLTGHARQAAQRAPQLGEHTDTVLTDLLDLSSDDLASLHARAVVGEPT